jgi:hypothetical protein
MAEERQPSVKNPMEVLAEMAEKNPQLAETMVGGATPQDSQDLGAAIGSAIDALKEKNNLELLTELDPNAVKLMTAIKARCEVTGNTIAPNVCQYLIEYMVSKNRMGREEIRDITKSAHQEIKQSMGGLTTRLKGWMGL